MNTYSDSLPTTYRQEGETFKTTSVLSEPMVAAMRERQGGTPDSTSPVAVKDEHVHSKVDDFMQPSGGEIRPDEDSELVFGRVKIAIPKGAVKEKVIISIEPLDKVSDLNPGMKNITAQAVGFRFLPDGMIFEKPVILSIPYDSDQIQSEEQAENLYTYFFNEDTGKWHRVQRIAVVKSEGVIQSATTHFTDMINSTLTMPESPKPLGFNINSIKDVKTANPGEGIKLIEDPKQAPDGSANLNYDIEVPPGRKGMQPRLSLAYNSDAGNGWLGLGWSLDMPCVVVDTRFGVPQYGSSETETYLLNGIMLSPTARTTAIIPRTAEKQFHTRIEGQFSRIIRHGDQPSNYSWEVKAKDGRTSYYGRTRATERNTVLAGLNGIFKWYLVEERDPRGNSIRYEYATVNESGGVELYISKVRWTNFVPDQSSNGLGIFTVQFVRDRDLGEPIRPDVIIDCRPGFKTVTADRLRRVYVKSGDQLIRSYGFEYTVGAFGKSLLSAIVQYGGNGSEFNRHAFSYYDEVRNGDVYSGFGRKSTIESTDDLTCINILDIVRTEKTMIGSSSSTDAGVNSFIGVNFFGNTKKNAVGATIGMNSSTSIGETLLIDMNGDGIADKLFNDGSGHHYYRPGFTDQYGNLGYSNTAYEIKGSFPQISRDTSTSFTVGGEAFPLTGYVGYTTTKTSTTGESYLTDANGDGLTDLVNGGMVLFSRLNGDGTLEFGPDSSDTALPVVSNDQPVMTQGMIDSIEAIYQQKLKASPVIDSVRMWEAPFDGKIKISGYVQLLGMSAQRYDTADGVRVSIQQNNDKNLLWPQGQSPLLITKSDHEQKIPKNAGTDYVETQVGKGDRIYFRVNSNFDGMYDQVHWQPRIEYSSIPTYYLLGAPLLWAPTDLAKRDANQLLTYVYDTGTDFIFAGRSGEIMAGFRTDLNISGSVVTNGKLTDDVTVSVYKVIVSQAEQGVNKTYVRQGEPIVIPWTDSNMVDRPINLPMVPIGEGEGIKFEIASDSPIDLSKIQWIPTVEYDHIYVGSEIVKAVDEQGKPKRLTAYCSYPVYAFSNDKLALGDVRYWKEGKSDWSGEKGDATIYITPEFNIRTDTQAGEKLPDDVARRVTFTVKSKGGIGRMAKQSWNLLPTSSTSGFNQMTLTSVQQGAEYYFEFTFADNEARARCSNFKVKYRYGSQAANEGAETDSCNVYERRDEGLLPEAYRGWSVFAYNGTGERGTNAINEDDLKPDKYVVEGIDQNTDPNNIKPSSIQGAKEPSVYIMYPDPISGTWKSEDDECWIKQVEVSSSRKGDNCPRKQEFDGGNSVFAVQKLGMADQQMIGASASVAGMNDVWGTSWSVIDYFDMNGDRFPDVVSEGSIQYTTMTGGLSKNATAIAKDHIRNSNNNCFSASLGGSASILKPNSNGNTNGSSKAGTVKKDPPLGLAPEVSLGRNDSTRQTDYIDMNSDGLPDKAIRSASGALAVKLNLGYSFGPEEQWCTGDISTSSNLQGTIKGGVSFNIDNYSFAGGVSASSEESILNNTLADMNGDGLPDYVESRLDIVSGMRFFVQLNTGSGMSERREWTGCLNQFAGKTFNQSCGGGAYFTIPIPIPCTTFFIIISPGMNNGVSLGSHTVTIMDVNGDGLPDHVRSEADNKIEVAYNICGRTNLLKRVDRPLGSWFEIVYSRAWRDSDDSLKTNSFNMPQGKWLMSSIRLNDGHPGFDSSGNDCDGADEILTKYDYKFPRYDRYERESYGFAQITKKILDPATDTVLRYEISEFENYESMEIAKRNYYARDLMKSNQVYDGAGNQISQKTNLYDYRVIIGDMGQDIRYASVVFPRLSRTDEYEFENGSAGSLYTYTTYSYDDVNNNGNIIGYVESRNSGQSLVSVQISYNRINDQNTYIVDRPNELFVRSADRKELRHRSGQYNGYGELVSWKAFEGSNSLSSSMEYDKYGNIRKVTDPTGYRMEYVYDQTTNTHITGVSDVWGYTSSSEYDLGLGKVTRSVDTNKQAMSYVYDEYGRTERVYGPYDGMTTPAVRFEYYQDERPARSVTHNKIHFDSGRGDTIKTVALVDGLMRDIQTKSQAEVWDKKDKVFLQGMIVTGPKYHDVLGRITQEGKPIFEGGESLSFNKNVPTLLPTHTAYDGKDREVLVTYPDGSAMNTQYGIENGRLKITVTDPLGRHKTVYKDSEENTVSIVTNRNSVKITTDYEYNPLGEIVHIMDVQGNSSRIEYDALGRKTSVTTPDTGITLFKYDTSGRLWKKVDENRKANGDSIVYEYDHSRLAKILYPKSDPVVYVYGTTSEAGNDNGNKAGRVASVSNGTSIVRYEYGRIGETTSVVTDLRRFYGTNQVVSSRMGYVYDYLGRMERITYPDGEVVDYSYDWGGKVKKVTGTRLGTTFNYVNSIGYDDMGKRTHIEYGNGVTTDYDYDPAREWLTHIATGNKSGLVFQNTAYVFDLCGNILNTENGSPASSDYVRQEYVYNDLYELVNARGIRRDLGAGGTVLAENEYIQTYSYDNIGNMLKKTSVNRLNPGGMPKELNYNYSYYYDEAHPHRATKIDNFRYDYDPNGNVVRIECMDTNLVSGPLHGGGELVSGGAYKDDTHGNAPFLFSEVKKEDVNPASVQNPGVRTFKWDEENRLTEMWTDTNHVRFAYDTAGARTVKYSDGGETLYVDKMYQVETTKNPRIVTKHIFVGDTRIVSKVSDEGAVSTTAEAANVYFYHPDHLQSSNYVTDKDGNEYEHVEYTPYGETWLEESRDELDRIDFMFTSKELDKETGLYYFGARYLDPKTSRWMSADPAFEKYLPQAPVNDDAKKNNENLPGEGGVFNATNLMLYHYAGNNPIKYTDPDGEHHHMGGKLTRGEDPKMPEILYGKDDYTSGGGKRGWGLDQHTERYFLNDIKNMNIKPNDAIEMKGEKDPCRSCMSKLRDFVLEKKVTAIYESKESGATFVIMAFKHSKAIGKEIRDGLKGSILQLKFIDGKLDTSYSWRYWKNDKNRWVRVNFDIENS